MTNTANSSTFSHILISAPTVDIAEVYKAQLAILRDSVPFLHCVAISCVSDPEGQRVGSGGGTLNGLAFVRKQFDMKTFDECRILVIHSGGESRRAPLYSLCGKAWTTINATLEGGEIASPIGLLIAELSKFCVNIPPGTLVVASSDVMLDIVVDQVSATFDSDSVTLVTVPEKPSVAKNHGVIVALGGAENLHGHEGVELIQSPAANYLQKPSLCDMEKNNALYTMHSFYSKAPVNQHQVEPFALVDTGVVVFTGAALRGLVALMDHPACAGCIASTLLPAERMQRDPSGAALRLELYTDLLLALRFRDQQDFSLAVYYSRLGLPPPSSASHSAYDVALSVVWETLQNIPLRMIFAPSGKFEHLGTTAEVLQLLTQQSSSTSASTITCTSNVSCTPETKTETGASILPSPKRARTLNKLQRFAHKYGLRSIVCSTVSPLLSSAIAINSIILSESPPSSGLSATSGVLIEHSLLFDTPVLPNSAVVSHLCAPLGRGLSVQDGIMLQQIYMKPNNNTSNSLPFTLMVLGIHDDTKAHYSHPASTLCGSTWSKLFQIAELDPNNIWPSSVPTQERCVWNARLFCESILDANGAIFVRTADSAIVPATRLTLTWLQDLLHLPVGGDPSALPSDYAHAVRQWVAARRLSLSDILTCGDATRMMQWRVWLQTAHNVHYTAPGRVSAQLGGDKMLQDLSTVFMFLLEFEHNVKEHVQSQDIPTMLLGYWLVQLVQGNRIAIADDVFLTVSECAFQKFYSQIRNLGNPRIYHVVSAYLKKLLLQDAAICATLQMLLYTVPKIAVNMHARVLFLCAWLVKNRNYHASDALSSVRMNALFRSVGGENEPQEFGSHLKACGEEIIQKISAAMLSSIQEPISESCEEESLSLALERVAQGLVALHLHKSLDVQQMTRAGSITAPSHVTAATPAYAPRWGVAVETRAPVRIDLAGGWSDTPPICYELSGAVLNVGVLVDGRHPIRCVSKMIAEPVLELRSTSLVGAQEYVTESISIDQWAEFDDLSCSGETKKCLLLRAVLVALRLVDISALRASNNTSMSEYLRSTFGGGISVSCVSDLPAGSGMGGSSILAAAALHSLSALLGLHTSPDALVSQVSQVEQLLTTGGGWQDQVGGVFGGLKLCESAAQLPLRVKVQTFTPSLALRAAFQRRVWLVYTGQQRLARNTLINALRYSALSPTETTPKQSAAAEIRPQSGIAGCPGTVAALVEGAHAGWALLQEGSAAMEETDEDDRLDRLSEVLNSYWELKTEMAAGSEPPHIADLLSQLRPLCSGLSLCGAGAGGFASVILKRGTPVSDLQMLIEAINLQNKANDAAADQLSLHSVSIDCVGIYSEDLPI